MRRAELGFSSKTKIPRSFLIDEICLVRFQGFSITHFFRLRFIFTFFCIAANFSFSKLSSTWVAEKRESPPPLSKQENPLVTHGKKHVDSAADWLISPHLTIKPRLARSSAGRSIKSNISELLPERKKRTSQSDNFWISLLYFYFNIRKCRCFRHSWGVMWQYFKMNPYLGSNSITFLIGLFSLFSSFILNLSFLLDLSVFYFLFCFLVLNCRPHCLFHVFWQRGSPHTV